MKPASLPKLSHEARCYLYEVFGVTEYALTRSAYRTTLDVIRENAEDASLTLLGENRLDVEIIEWVKADQEARQCAAR